MDRREFLKQGALIGVGAVAGCSQARLDPYGGLLRGAEKGIAIGG